MNVPTRSRTMTREIDDALPCPCGSAENYGRCCARYHRSEAPAPSPEALMRSRYTAFALGGLGDYLVETWDPRTLDPTLTPAQLDQHDSEWLGLEIVDVESSGARGVVEFKVRFRPCDAASTAAAETLHERSRFRRIKGQWVYVDGIIDPPAPTASRNAPCLCGSGKKAKRCCQA